MIKGQNIILRKCEPEDHRFILSLFNDRKISVMEGRQEFPISLYSQSCWYEKNHNDPNMIRLVIQDLKTGEPVGYTTFELLDPVSRTAHTAIKLAPCHWKKGYAVDAVKTLMSFVYFEQNINRLSTHIVEYNTASLKLYTEKCGWQIEGRARESVFMHGRYYDNILLGCLKKEYLAFETDEFYRPEALL